MIRYSTLLIAAYSILFSVLCYAGNGYSSYSSSYTATSKYEDANQIQIELIGETISTSSYIEFDLRRIGSYDALDFFLSSVSTGNITTANIDWVLNDGTVITSNTITSGTPQTVMKSSFAKLKIYNYKAIPALVTGNILFTDN